MSAIGTTDLAALREQVRDALDMLRVGTFDGVTLRKSGVNQWAGLCPFHTEKTPSFVCDGKFRGRYKCWGCGEEGDIFDYWQKRRGVDHLQAVKELAGLAGVYVGELQFERPKAGVARTPERRLDEGAEEHEKPSLPPLYKPSKAACEAIAQGRKLDAEAVWIAARVHGRVGYALWPQYHSHGEWRLRSNGVHPSWAAMDRTRNVAEFRRLDNGLYTKQDGGTLKVWSTAGKSWPLGAMEVTDTRRVLLVEGGPDMLAAYHFLKLYRMLDKVSVVCMLGAGNRLREDALPFFAGCRVRIMVDADTPKDDEQKAKRKLVGTEAAARWQAQLSEAGAAVETFAVGDIYDPADVEAWHEGNIKAADIKVITPGYVTREGAKVKDLNDLATCADDVVWSDDVRQAMRAWDF